MNEITDFKHLSIRCSDYTEKNKEEIASSSSQAGTSESEPLTVINILRKEYLDVMRMVDVQSGEEIKSGHEMKGIMTFINAKNRLTEIHNQLSIFYGALFRFSDFLKQNNSQRLKQLGHEMLPTLELLELVIDVNIFTRNNPEIEAAVKDDYIIDMFSKIGLRKQHRYINNRLLLEIEYMIDTLSILIEPDFMPNDSNDNSSLKDETDRYIPSEVRLKVWRRDQGKCVQCGSNEMLEYDHIIPISKGGNNTERNIQLLCQKCNRKKGSAIQ